MLELLPGVLLGVAVCGVGYIGYLAAIKGVPAAIAKVKSWWTATENALAGVKSDLAALEARVVKLEGQAKTIIAPAGLTAAAATAAAQPAPGVVVQSPNSNG